MGNPGGKRNKYQAVEKVLDPTKKGILANYHHKTGLQEKSGREKGQEHKEQPQYQAS